MFMIGSIYPRIRVHIGQWPLTPKRILLKQGHPASQIEMRSSIEESKVPIRTPKSLEKRKLKPIAKTPILSQKAFQFLMVVKR